MKAVLLLCSALALGCPRPVVTHQDSPDEEPTTITKQAEIKLEPVTQGAALVPKPTLLLTLDDFATESMEHRWSGTRYLTLKNHFARKREWTNLTDLNQTATVWETTTGKELLSFDAKIDPEFGNTGIAFDIRFSPDAKSLIAWGMGGSVLWDAATGAQRLVLEQTFQNPGSGEDQDWATEVALSADSAQLATSSGCGNLVKIWSTKDASAISSSKFKQHKILETDGYPCQTRIEDIDFSPDGKKIVSTNVEEATRVSSTKTGKTLFTLSDCKLKFDENEVYSDGKSHTLRYYWSHGGLHTAIFSPDGGKILTANNCNDERNVRLWDATTGKKLAALEKTESSVYSAAFSPDGATFLLADSEGVGLWDVATAKRLTTFGGSQLFTQASFNKDGTRIVGVSNDHTVKIWETATGKELFALVEPSSSVKAATGKEPPRWIRSAVFSPDGTMVSVTSSDDVTTIWKLP